MGGHVFAVVVAVRRYRRHLFVEGFKTAEIGVGVVDPPRALRVRSLEWGAGGVDDGDATG